MIKRIVFIVCCVPLIIYSVLLYNNNVPSAPVSHEDIERSFNRSVDWLVTNRLELYDAHNPYLWWMISEAKKNSKNPALSNVFQGYLLRIRENPGQAANPFNAIILPSLQEPIPAVREITDYMEPYQAYLYYSFTCDNAWGNLDAVVQQHDPEFCWRHQPFSSACTTHQLLGNWYQKIYKCQRSEVLDSRIDKLRNYIYVQLFLDPRVVDVYLQRVLMLALTGDIDGISASWIRQILDAQLDEGGWNSNSPIFSLGSDDHIGFKTRGIGRIKNQATFHATAQGILLMSILRDKSI